MKLRKKLILSCAALAACATTMVSTTYAWYTSATDVSVSGVTGTTNNASTDGSLLVAKQTSAGVFGTYSNAVTIGADETAAYINRGDKLEPLALNDNGALIAQADAIADILGTDSVTTTHVNASGAFICIPLKFKTTKNTQGSVNIYFKSISITNNATGALTKVDGIANGGGVTAGTPYSIDACYAMNMMVCDSDTVYNSTNDTLVDLGGYVQTNETAAASLTGTAAKYDKTAGAHAYYNAAMTANKYNEKTLPSDSRLIAGGSAATSLHQFTIDQNGSGDKEKVLYFVFYLDGWDNDCFDACRGQSFTINLGFTSNSDGAISLVAKS